MFHSVGDIKAGGLLNYTFIISEYKELITLDNKIVLNLSRSQDKELF